MGRGNLRFWWANQLFSVKIRQKKFLCRAKALWIIKFYGNSTVNKLNRFHQKIEWVDSVWKQDLCVLLKWDNISWPRTLVNFDNFVQWLVANIHSSSRRSSFTTKRMDSRKHVKWACIGSHNQFSTLQIWNWNSNLVCESETILNLGSEYLMERICGRFKSKPYRNSCRSTRRSSATNKYQGCCSQIKGKSKTTTERTCWYTNYHTDARKKIDWHWAITTNSRCVRFLQESDQSSSTQSKKMEQLNSAESNFIFGIILHKYSNGLMIGGNLVWQQEEVRKEDICIALIIREESFTSELFRDTLEIISLILRYRQCSNWDRNIPSHLPHWMRIQSSLYYQQWIDTWRSRVEQETDSILLAHWSKRQKKIMKILIFFDFSVPRRARYVHSAWKKHQDWVFLVDIDLAIREGLTVYQTRMQLFFKEHFQLIAFQKLKDWRLEKLCMKDHTCLFDHHQRSHWDTITIGPEGMINWVLQLNNSQSGISFNSLFEEVPRVKLSKPTQWSFGETWGHRTCFCGEK